METQQNKEKWYDNKFVTHLLLVIFFPVGLYALWKSRTIAKWWKITATVIIGLIVIANLGDTSNRVSSDKDEQKAASGTNLDFERIGYYKGNNNLRYFTFYVKSSESLNRDSLSEDVFEELKKHGSKQSNTSGQITASFYYIDRNSVPDITNLDPQGANDLAHNRKPIAAIWIMPTGQINLIKNPE